MCTALWDVGYDRHVCLMVGVVKTDNDLSCVHAEHEAVGCQTSKHTADQIGECVKSVTLLHWVSPPSLPSSSARTCVAMI